MYANSMSTTLATDFKKPNKSSISTSFSPSPGVPGTPRKEGSPEGLPVGYMSKAARKRTFWRSGTLMGPRQPPDRTMGFMVLM